MRKRMNLIHNNLLFTDWWHTGQLIRYVADLEFDVALQFANEYILSEDPFVRRWGYVLFISRLCTDRGGDILPLMHNDDHYYVQMAQAWLTVALGGTAEDEKIRFLVDMSYELTKK